MPRAFEPSLWVQEQHLLAVQQWKRNSTPSSGDTSTRWHVLQGQDPEGRGAVEVSGEQVFEDFIEKLVGQLINVSSACLRSSRRLVWVLGIQE